MDPLRLYTSRPRRGQQRSRVVVLQSGPGHGLRRGEMVRHQALGPVVQPTQPHRPRAAPKGGRSRSFVASPAGGVPGCFRCVSDHSGPCRAGEIRKCLGLLHEGLSGCGVLPEISVVQGVHGGNQGSQPFQLAPEGVRETDTGIGGRPRRHTGPDSRIGAAEVDNRLRAGGRSLENGLGRGIRLRLGTKSQVAGVRAARDGETQHGAF